MTCWTRPPSLVSPRADSRPWVPHPRAWQAEQLYAAHPERLYGIMADGTIGYKGGMGPFGYKPQAVRCMGHH